jgi:hypothetical protein
MDKHSESKPDSPEHGVKATLESLADMAARMGHPSGTMEIIGIVAPEDVEQLQQQTSDSNSVIPLPDKPSNK